ncbi:MAG: hypothetical protein SGJ19_11165 [Planctomycetia bacterium]|mgnify:CR=1 FL=1|nr:hypothetical protein [Planctomycetia bacterium]
MAATMYSVGQGARLYHLDTTAYLTNIHRQLPAILPRTLPPSARSCLTSGHNRTRSTSMPCETKDYKPPPPAAVAPTPTAARR